MPVYMVIFYLYLELNKYKQLVSKKDKFINSQNLLISKLQAQLRERDSKQQPETLLPNTETKEACKISHISTVNTDDEFSKVSQISEENAFLKRKYRKYHHKYGKYKSLWKMCANRDQPNNLSQVLHKKRKNPNKEGSSKDSEAGKNCNSRN